MTALYTSDAVLLPQGSDQPIIGQANIRKFFDDWFSQRLENASIPVTEVKMIDQKTLWAAGTWSVDVPGQNGGSSTHVNGTWSNIMSQDGSEWRLGADTWNMMPPAKPPDGDKQVNSVSLLIEQGQPRHTAGVV